MGRARSRRGWTIDQNVTGTPYLWAKWAKWAKWQGGKANLRNHFHFFLPGTPALLYNDTLLHLPNIILSIQLLALNNIWLICKGDEDRVPYRAADCLC